MKCPKNATNSRRAQYAALFRRLRRRARLTQVQLATLLRVSQGAISERERGAVDIRIEELDALARMAGTTLAAALLEPADAANTDAERSAEERV